jgi:hypothetical protein
MTDTKKPKHTPGPYSFRLYATEDDPAELAKLGMKPVRMLTNEGQLALMAGEGDVTITGDKFEIQKLNSTNWELLSHGGNSTNNFFNSSIFTGGNTRNPNLVNNTGMDISMFNIPNASNSVIGNGQTSTAINPAPVTYLSNPTFFDTTYYITLRAFNECDTTSYLDSVIVRADPKARFAVSSSSGCSPFTIQVTNSSLGNPHTYFWFHYLFGELYNHDFTFRKLWDNVIKISANGLGPHYLQEKGLCNKLNIHIKNDIDNKITPLYKLTYKCNFPPHDNEVNIYYLYSTIP